MGLPVDFEPAERSFDPVVGFVVVAAAVAGLVEQLVAVVRLVELDAEQPIVVELAVGAGRVVPLVVS